METEKGTYSWYAKQLNISERTAKRRGKQVLEQQIGGFSGVDGVVGVVGGNEEGERRKRKPPEKCHNVGILDVHDLDLATKEQASIVLNSSMVWLDNWLKEKENTSKESYKAQIVVSLIKAIASGK